jgi:hypothetical protein
MVKVSMSVLLGRACINFLVYVIDQLVMFAEYGVAFDDKLYPDPAAVRHYRLVAGLTNYPDRNRKVLHQYLIWLAEPNNLSGADAGALAAAQAGKRRGSRRAIYKASSSRVCGSYLGVAR